MKGWKRISVGSQADDGQDFDVAEATICGWTTRMLRPGTVGLGVGMG